MKYIKKFGMWQTKQIGVFPFTNRSWFLFYSTALWAVIGLIAGGVISENPLFG